MAFQKANLSFLAHIVLSAATITILAVASAVCAVSPVVTVADSSWANSLAARRTAAVRFQALPTAKTNLTPKPKAKAAPPSKNLVPKPKPNAKAPVPKAKVSPPAAAPLAGKKPAATAVPPAAPATTKPANANAAPPPAAAGTAGNNGTLVWGSSNVNDNAWDPSFNINCRCNGGERAPFCAVGADGTLNLHTDNFTSGGFSCNNYYVFGTFSVRMKLPKGFSGGAIPCMYLISAGSGDYHSKHDEIDFEFLGGEDPSNMTIHTNYISGGYALLEQFKFPFDPSADFHTYSIVWSHNYVIWMLDQVPIRITYKQNGRPFPSMPMAMHGSIWPAPWLHSQVDLTQGDYSVQYRNFKFNGCSTQVGANQFAYCTRSRSTDLPWMRPLMGRQMAAMQAYQTQFTKATFQWAQIA